MPWFLGLVCFCSNPQCGSHDLLWASHIRGYQRDSMVSKSSKMSLSRKAVYASIALVLLACYNPSFTWHCIMLVDYFTEWSAFDSPYVQQYHNYLMSKLPDRAEIPAIEIQRSEATLETISAATNYYTVNTHITHYTSKSR